MEALRSRESPIFPSHRQSSLGSLFDSYLWGQCGIIVSSYRAKEFASAIVLMGSRAVRDKTARMRDVQGSRHPVTRNPRSHTLLLGGHHETPRHR